MASAKRNATINGHKVQVVTRLEGEGESVTVYAADQSSRRFDEGEKIAEAWGKGATKGIRKRAMDEARAEFA